MGKNSETIGVVLLVLLIAGALGDNGNAVSGSRQGANHTGLNGLSRLLPVKGLEFTSLARDFHRMVDVMGKVDNIGQMAVNPPKLPEPSQLINTSALPDLSGIMEVMGPLLNNFNGTNEK